ncbi:MAG TPA: hypothetical protein VHU77_07135 [Candidatus Limnocylindria bacterium]|jgi:hypothetical protein|nr:hypothetical protein [Candidatus Limnocylindria bacterium]
MRRTLPTALVAVLGLVLLLDFVVINPTLATLSDVLLELVVLLAAAAAVAGGIALVVHHVAELAQRRTDPLGSLVLLAGFAVILVAGLYPGSAGTSDPVVRWLVAGILGPLVASLFAMLVVFLLRATGRGLQLRPRQAGLMVAAAFVVIVLLLPLGGQLGSWLASAAGFAMAVPIAGVFRGLLIGVAVVTAVQAARILVAVDGGDD